MSRTASDVASILYRHLKESALFSDEKAPNGILCRDQRPANSMKEDVVINVVELDEGHPVQKGTAEIFIYVPNLENKTVTPVDKSMPNSYRLQYLNTLASQALKGQYLEMCHIGVFKHLPCEQDGENHQHYAKFIVEFHGPNLD